MMFALFVVMALSGGHEDTTHLGRGRHGSQIESRHKEHMFPLLIAILPWLQTLPPAAASYVPERVYDTRLQAFSDFEVMLADLARADAVFLGEQHDDANTHRLELAVLEGLTRRGVPVIVSLEMFERDVQAAVDRYASGAITEEQFLKDARPWP